MKKTVKKVLFSLVLGLMVLTATVVAVSPVATVRAEGEIPDPPIGG